jgi:hypothetical protein
VTRALPPAPTDLAELERRELAAYAALAQLERERERLEAVLATVAAQRAPQYALPFGAEELQHQ